MFYMMNDDMDDMMRKAADEYELNHEMASDWNKVYAGIQQPEQDFIIQSKQKKRKRYLLFLWFLLIPAMLITVYKMNLFTISSFHNTTKAEAKYAKGEQHKKLYNEVQRTNNNNAVNNSSVINLQQVDKKMYSISARRSIATSTNFLSSNIYKNKSAINNFLNAGNGIVTNNYKQALANSDQNISVQELASTNTTTGLINKNQTGIIHKVTGTDTITIKQQLLNNNDNITASKNINKDAAVIKSSAKKNKANNYARPSFAYAGIIMNADISFIKNQKASSPALGGGLIGGYHFKNGISIESGLLYERKNYYTKGKYFNTGKLSYLQNVQLLATNGNCYMYEIPLNTQYDFKSHKKFNWFVTAGVSSYLMHKEYYNFKYDYNGSYGEKSYDYYHTSKDWFAVLNVGAGVNIQTSNKYFVKVQPYYKAPLSGVGIGSLPLSSAGINFSFIRRIP